MGNKIKISKEDYYDFLNKSTFFDYYYSQYLQNHLEDAFIEQHKELLESLIATDAFHTIQNHAQKKMLSSTYTLSSRDHKNFLSIKEFTTRLELLLIQNHLL